MTCFLLNGAPRQVDFEPGRTVLDHLRLHERLTGTKEGCAEGDCGACTIALGRKQGEHGLAFVAVNSCIMLARDLADCAVITAEGVAHRGVLAPAQQAMVDEHGSQCGFCTPGFVMSLFALGQLPPPATPRARRDATLDALAGNLCRCTGYRPILAAADAMGSAADPRIPAWRNALDALGDDALGDETLGDDMAPRDLAGLDACLARWPAAKLTAGTTDLGVPIAKHGEVPAAMVSLRRVAELAIIEARDDHLYLGATATYSEILPHLARHFPNFAGLVRRIGSLQIRNAGTMGGNICNASPIGDSAPCLIALDATVLLRGAAGERELPVAAFFSAYRKTALQSGEYLRAIKIPYLYQNDQFFAYKLAKRFDQDISAVAGAFKLRVDNQTIVSCRAAFGGMAATPIRVPAIEAALAGQPCVAATFAAAGAIAAQSFTPLSDFRASADYRLRAAAGFLQRLGAEMRGQPADIWAL